MNSVEFQEYGLQAEEAKIICQILEREKFDFVELSGGTYEELGWLHKRESTKAREGYFMEWADLIVPQLSQTRSYVTGGFKSAPAMVQALKTIDGVGFGRPICQEPNLPKDILDGRISSVIQSVIPDDQYLLTTLVAGTHLRQLAEGREPFDMSRQEQVDNFMASVAVFMERLKAGEVLSWPDMQ